MVIPALPELYLSKGSISDMEALISFATSLLNNDWPFNCKASPEITSAIATCLLVYFAKDGFINFSSKFKISGSIPYKALNKILKDSLVPLVLYNDFDSFIKEPASNLEFSVVFSKPGVNVYFVFL